MYKKFVHDYSLNILFSELPKEIFLAGFLCILRLFGLFVKMNNSQNEIIIPLLKTPSIACSKDLFKNTGNDSSHLIEICILAIHIIEMFLQNIVRNLLNQLLESDMHLVFIPVVGPEFHH